jgi:hypothetical protein
MADDKGNTGGNDRRQVAGEEAYEVAYFAERHGISREQARDLIDQQGNDRAALDAAAEKLTA